MKSTCVQPNIRLTSSLFVLHKDLQLQQPPGNIRIIPHHSQSGLKLSLHAKLHTAVSYTDGKRKELFKAEPLQRETG